MGNYDEKNNIISFILVFDSHFRSSTVLGQICVLVKTQCPFSH